MTPEALAGLRRPLRRRCCPLDSAVAFPSARRPRRRSRRRWSAAASRCGCRASPELTAGNQCRVHSADGRLIAIGEIAGNLHAADEGPQRLSACASTAGWAPGAEGDAPVVLTIGNFDGVHLGHAGAARAGPRAGRRARARRARC